MRRWGSGVKILFVCFILSRPGAANVSHELTADLGLQGRSFPSQPAFSPQTAFDVSPSLQPNFLLQWENQKQTVTISPFLRYDSADARRTHFDLSEASYVKAGDGFELRVGVRKVFWGSAEAFHLVDIINQLDLVEDFRENARLGQPMVNPLLVTEFGNFELFILPYFRERTFPGTRGHFRPEFSVNTDAVTYESPNGRWNPDLAFRYSHHVGIVEFGLAHFYGTSRLPDLNSVKDASGNFEYRIFYPSIEQTSLDMEINAGNFVGKVEMLERGDKHYANAYWAGIWGGEYTFPQIWGRMSLGVLLEYLYDSRGTAAPTAFEDDIFVGLRLELNDSGDTEVLLTSILDRTSANQLYSAEAGRKFGKDWKLALKLGYFNTTTTTDPLYTYYRDNYIQLEVTRFLLP